jgi:hypothetical protein
MKVRESSLFGESFAYHFQIKLNTHFSNPNSVFVPMDEPKFFLLIGVLTKNFNIVNLIKVLEITQKLHI